MKSRYLRIVLAVIALLSPVAANAYGPPVSIPDRFKGVILFAPEPDYPLYLMKQTAIEQSVYRLKINPQTGVVDEVAVLVGCKDRRLDANAVMGLFTWKFKPGTIKQLDVPMMWDRYLHVNLSKAASVAAGSTTATAQNKKAAKR